MKHLVSVVRAFYGGRSGALLRWSISDPYFIQHVRGRASAKAYGERKARQRQSQFFATYEDAIVVRDWMRAGQSFDDAYARLRSTRDDLSQVRQ